MERFLKAKHWQLFILMIGLPFFTQIITILVGFFGDFDTAVYLSPLSTILYLAFFMGWFWSIGSTFHHMVPETVKLNLKRFKSFIIIASVYVILFSTYTQFQAAGIIESDTVSASSMLWSFAIIFPLHLFSMFCIFYALWFNAKTIKSIELQKNVSFPDYAGEFFLIWFFPIGIWFIQPKLNKLLKEKEHYR